jgi:hypothetical protein
MPPRRPTPGIAVLIRHPGDAATLGSVLDGFTQQTLPDTASECLVVAPGPGETMAAAWNAALAKTTAPLVLLFDGRYRPLPGLLAYGLEFHRAHPAPEQAALVGVASDVSMRTHPLHQWQCQAGIFPDQPRATGVYAWPWFRSRGTFCTRELLSLAAFDSRFEAGEDVHLAARLTRRAPLTVAYHAIPQALFVGPLHLEPALESAYLDGYYRRVRIDEDPWARTDADTVERFACAERYLLNGRDGAGMSASLVQLDASCQRIDPVFASDEEAERLQLAGRLYDTFFAHAAARGWLDAEQRIPAAPASLWTASAPRRRRTS